MKFRFDLDEENFTILRRPLRSIDLYILLFLFISIHGHGARHFSPEISDTADQGWEEKVGVQKVVK